MSIAMKHGRLADVAIMLDNQHIAVRLADLVDTVSLTAAIVTGNKIDASAYRTIIADKPGFEKLTLDDEQAERPLVVLISNEDVDDPVLRPDMILRNDFDDASLKSFVVSGLQVRDRLDRLREDVAGRQSAVGSIIEGQFDIRTPTEARNLATMLALACPDPGAVVVGLQELMLNSIEHGNLDIGGERKQELIDQGKLADEVQQRLEDPEYSDRYVRIGFHRGDRIISFTFQDEGAGFDHTLYEGELKPSGQYRGRGIALARTISFDELVYSAGGSLARATIMLEETADETLLL